MSPQMRGRTTRERRIAERVAEEFAERHRRPSQDREVDFDLAEVDAEVVGHGGAGYGTPR